MLRSLHLDVLFSVAAAPSAWFSFVLSPSDLEVAADAAAPAAGLAAPFLLPEEPEEVEAVDVAVPVAPPAKK